MCPICRRRRSNLLVRAGAATSLSALGIDGTELRAALDERADLPRGRILRALHGRRPSARVRLADFGLELPVSVAGPPVANARTVVIALHGRGSNAGAFVERLFEMTGDAPEVTVVAPQARGNAWYPKAYGTSLVEHGEDLARALDTVEQVVSRVLRETSPERVFVVGFSQGACLAAEYVARSDRSLGGLIALSGARIGPASEQLPARASFDGMKVLLGVSADDPHVSTADVEATAAFLRDAGADVEVASTTGDGHRITAVQRIRARELLLGRSVTEGQAGFGNVHQSEALEGALPRGQNSPRRDRYGLYAEQVNATGFSAPRHDNQRSWLYRIRPSAQHSQLEPLAHPRFRGRFDEAPPDPNLLGWAPVPIPDAPTDFVDGLATIGGAGSPALRRGFAIHAYAANRSMEDRAFYDADGELLLVPQRGRLTLLTEAGVLEVEPGRSRSSRGA